MGTYGLEANGKIHRDERFLYFRQIMKSLGKYDEKNIYLCPSNHTQFGYELGKEIIRKGRLPRAVFLETPGLSTVKLHNDLVGMMAAKTLMECLYTKREQGLKIIVPNQLILRESCPE